MINLDDFIGSYGPVSPTLKPCRIVGFDTEDDSRGTPISFAFHTGTETFYTRDADEAVEYIFNSPDVTCFVAHNLEYDIGNLFKHCDFKYVHEMIYASRLLTVSLFGSKNFFLNSSSFFQGPLKALGKLVGLPKLEGDPFSEVYNLRDAEIPQLFMSRMQDRLNKMGINLGVSIGQLSMATYRRNFMRERIMTFNKPDCLEAYYGGRVEVFYKGVITGPLHVADIRSSYPDVMRNEAYPDTSTIEPSMLATHRFGYGRFTIEVPDTLFIPPLPYRSAAGRLFFPTGILTGCWTYAEVREAVAMGCRVLAETPGFGTRYAVNPYGEFIDSFWDQREAVKKKLKVAPDDPDANFESLFLKLIMNNRYGKDAQHKPSTLMTRFRMAASKLEQLKGVTECKIGPFFGYTIPREKAPRTANYLWGVHTTAYARISLLRKMVAVHASGARLLYCDTDSIMFTGEAGKNALDFGPGLGQMDLETYDLGVFRQAKGYLLCNRGEDGIHDVVKVACKGVPTQYALEFIQEGLARALKPMRLKEAQIRIHAKTNKDKENKFFEDIGVNVWREVPKTMKGVYIKRSGARGVTRPVNVAQIPLLEATSFSLEGRMEDMDGIPFRPQVKPGEVFRNVRIPPGWHRRTNALVTAEKFFTAQKMQFLRREQLEGLAKGDAWFSGRCLRVESGKYGKFLVFRLSTFLKSNVKAKNILAALPLKFISVKPENIFGKSVEIILAKEYISTGYIELTVSIRK